MIKNIEDSKILSLKDEVAYQPGQIVSKTIMRSDKISISLFAFDKGEGLSAQTSNGDALVVILDGVAEIAVADKTFILNEGDSILIPKFALHSMTAIKPFKMYLTIVFA